jgi:hypothetical protein
VAAGVGIGVEPAVGVGVGVSGRFGVGEGRGTTGHHGTGVGMTTCGKFGVGWLDIDPGSTVGVAAGSPVGAGVVDAALPLGVVIATEPPVLLLDAPRASCGTGRRRAITRRKQRMMAMPIRTRVTRSKSHLLHRPVHDNAACNAIRKVPPFVDGAVSE